MKRRTVPMAPALSAVVLIAVVMATVFALPAEATLMTITSAKAITGSDAADMARDLMAADPHLRAAVAAHDQRGRPLMLDAATVILGHQEPSEELSASCTLSAKSSTFLYDNVELIFMPDSYSTGYWEGTVEARQYDGQGNLVAEYLANVTGEAPDGTTPLTTTYEHVLYSFDKDPTIRVKIGADPEQPDGPSLGLKSNQNGDLAGQQAQLSTREWLGGWSDWGKCTGTACVAAGAGCAAGNLIDAEIGWLPCTAIGCVGGAVLCTWGTLWK